MWFWDLLKWGLDCASLENAIRFQSSRKRRFPKFILVSTGRVSHRELISRSTRGSESKITVSTYGEGLLLLLHIVENLTLRDRESMVAQVTPPLLVNPFTNHGVSLYTMVEEITSRDRKNMVAQVTPSFTMNPSWRSCCHIPTQLCLPTKGHSSKCHEHINLETKFSSHGLGGLGHSNHGRW